MFLCTEEESTSSKRSYLRISFIDSMILNHLVNSTKEKLPSSISFTRHDPFRIPSPVVNFKSPCKAFFL